MFNLDRTAFDITCPRCQFATRIQYRDARLRNVLICRGCKANLSLDDHMNECRKTRKQVNAALNELQETLAPDGHLKFPHPWPPQTPPGGDGTRWTLVR